ncbi:MAG: NlpC/P60 family protein [bacterium]|nr:NlpC/P60 family protein [bacterium]
MARKKLTSGLFTVIVVALLASGSAVAYAEKENLSKDAAVVAESTKDITAAEKISNSEALSRAVELYEKLRNTEVPLPSEMVKAEAEEGIDETYLKAVVLGYANLEDYGKIIASDSIRKQDMINILYKTVINYDSSYAITGDEADIILNDCYDNAYINEENRVAYAFMMKQGIISEGSGSNPDKELTRESCEVLTEEVYDLFMKEISFDLGDADITVGANISTVTDKLGMPNRIDESLYGYDWYVYNADAANLVMVGVKADRVCAVYSNSMNFGVGSVKVGDSYVRAADYRNDDAFSFYTDSKGKIDAVLYNTADKDAECSEESVKACAQQTVDMINGYRARLGLKEYVTDTAMNEAAAEAASAYSGDVSVDDGSVYALGFDPFCIYNSLVQQENEVLTKESKTSVSAGAGFHMDENHEFVFALSEGRAVRTASVSEKPVVKLEKTDYKLKEVQEVTTPVIETPSEEILYNDGEDVVIKLAMQAATEYHVEVFDVENDDYAVNEYIKTDKTEITLPSELFKRGADYRMVVSSITPDGISLSSEDVLFSYGSAAEDGVVIETPYNDESTDDDYLAVSWSSEQYHDFMIDLYDDEGKLLTSEIVKDKYEAVIRGVDPGEYYVYVTALRRDTNIEKAKASVKVKINMPEPVITETILEPDDTYYFVYDDPEMGVLYFYDEEIIDVEQKNKNGKTETVKRKKIIQKQVKATKAYKELAKDRRLVESVPGTPTLDFLTSVQASEMGQKIVNEASKYLGVPYVWGGTTPSGFDCSGLVQYVLKNLGIDISRVTQTQCKEGVPVAKGDLQPGDLVFFESNGDVHHVGIYIGNGQMLHAPRTGDVVKITDMNTPYYSSTYYCARRIY